jgi:hypothetical protein
MLDHELKMNHHKVDASQDSAVKAVLVLLLADQQLSSKILRLLMSHT